MKELKIELMLEGAKKPWRAYDDDAGADLYSPIETILPAGEVTTIDLGVGIELPVGYMAIVQPRSGHTKRGIIAQIPPIDYQFRGSISAMILNSTNEDYIVEKNERLGQLVVIPIVTPKLKVVKSIDKNTNRRDKKFNSTGR